MTCDPLPVADWIRDDIGCWASPAMNIMATRCDEFQTARVRIAGRSISPEEARYVAHAILAAAAYAEAGQEDPS